MGKSNVTKTGVEALVVRCPLFTVIWAFARQPVIRYQCHLSSYPNSTSWAAAVAAGEGNGFSAGRESRQTACVAVKGIFAVPKTELNYVLGKVIWTQLEGKD